jgi:hypothetical protein
MRLELGERHLDGIEVGTVGRQELHPDAFGADGSLGGWALMGGHRLPRMTTSPLARVGANWVSIQVSKMRRFIG